MQLFNNIIFHTIFPKNTCWKKFAFKIYLFIYSVFVRARYIVFYKNKSNNLKKKLRNIEGTFKVYFSNYISGGAKFFVDKKIEEDFVREKSVILISFNFRKNIYILRLYKNTSKYEEFFFFHFSDLVAILKSIHIATIVINDISFFKDPIETLKLIKNIAQEKEAEIAIYIHDFFILCPSFFLLNEKGKFCELPEIEICKNCLKNNCMDYMVFRHKDIVEWRKIWYDFLNFSNRIIVFSEFTKECILKIYPELNMKIHLENMPREKLIPQEEIQKNKDNINIGILGLINFTKGSEILKDICKYVHDKYYGKISFIVFGEILDEIIKSKSLVVLGKYDYKNLPNLVAKQSIDAFLNLSICPETYSLICDEIIDLQKPLIVFNLGAQKEKASKYDKGFVLDSMKASDIIENILSLRKEGKI